MGAPPFSWEFVSSFARSTTGESEPASTDDTYVAETEPEPVPVPIFVPVDWYSVIPLFLLPAADPMTYAVIFPFITEYITSLGTPQTRSAYTYGRDRCAILGFAGIVGSAVLVGFGRSVWWIIFWRASFGLKPSGVLPRIMIAECLHPSNRAFIFSLHSPVFNLGYGRLTWFLGVRWADVWREWPYGLPCLVVAAAGGITLILCQINLKDHRPHLYGHGEQPCGTDHAGPQSARDKVKATLKIPYFAMSLTVFCVSPRSSIETAQPDTAFGRAFEPTLSGWLFSYSTQFEPGSLGRQNSWMSLLLITISPSLVSGLLPRTIEDLDAIARRTDDDEGSPLLDEACSDPKTWVGFDSC
ncbi:hypothetical protein IAU59_007426 [Kwoniella sp. CBS 9459]